MFRQISRVAAILTGALFLLFFLSACTAPAAQEPARPTAAPQITAGRELDITQAPTAAAPQSDTEEARATLESFLVALNDGRYDEAAALYGGDYELLRGYNPGLALDDHAALLERACTANGFVCLRPSSVANATIEGDTISFQVSFITPDGAIFSFFPPPGAEGQPTSHFILSVQKTADGFRVVSLPPYVS